MTTRYVGNGIIGVLPRLWEAEVTYLKGETVRSQLDFELYTRIAATGTDTVDPADDITKYAAASYRRVVAMASPTVAEGVSITPPTVSATAALVVPANTRQNVLSASGKGYCSYLLLVPTTPTSFSVGVRFEVEIDGRTVLNFTITRAVNGTMPLLSAGATTTAAGVEGLPLEFRRSMNVYVTAGSTAITAGTIYHRTVSVG